jgi:hypothetical protein
VLDVQRAVDERERPERLCDGRAHIRKRADGANTESEGERSGERVLTETHARLAMEESVIECVQQGDRGRAGEDQGLGRAVRRLGLVRDALPPSRPS